MTGTKALSWSCPASAAIVMVTGRLGVSGGGVGAGADGDGTEVDLVEPRTAHLQDVAELQGLTAKASCTTAVARGSPCTVGRELLDQVRVHGEIRRAFWDPGNDVLFTSHGCWGAGRPWPEERDAF